MPEDYIIMKRYYFLLDEIQEITGWEKAVNNLLEGMNSDTYRDHYFTSFAIDAIDDSDWKVRNPSVKRKS